MDNSPNFPTAKHSCYTAASYCTHEKCASANYVITFMLQKTMHITTGILNCNFARLHFLLLSYICTLLKICQKSTCVFTPVLTYVATHMYVCLRASYSTMPTYVYNCVFNIRSKHNNFSLLPTFISRIGIHDHIMTCTIGWI